MAAPIVEHFQLPPRRLPAACYLEGSFIAVADGPSSQEYDLAEFARCTATKFCYGRIARSITPQYYALADPGFVEVLSHLPPTRVLISRDGPYTGKHAEMYWEQLPKDRGHEYSWAADHCAHHPVLNGLHLGAKQLFLLGYDGYHRNDGRLKAASHAEQLHDTTIISRAVYAEQPAATQRANFWLSDINRISWDMTIKATHRAQGISPPIFNLSFGSRHRPVWDAHPDVLQQPFGRIDRRGPAMVIHLLQSDDEIKDVPLQPAISRARWGPLHVRNHAEFINGLRAIEPSLAIYVRTHARLADLAQLLHDDIQVAGLDAQLQPHLHSEVTHFRLPPVNEHWGIDS